MIHGGMTRQPAVCRGWAAGLAALLLVLPACAGESPPTADESESDRAPTLSPTPPSPPTAGPSSLSPQTPTTSTAPTRS